MGTVVKQTITSKKLNFRVHAGLYNPKILKPYSGVYSFCDLGLERLGASALGSRFRVYLDPLM